MRKRDRWSVFAIALLLGTLGIAMYWITVAPPAAVRYLPKATGILYIDLKPIRAAGFFDRNAVRPEDDYQQFINATGIDFERDLDEAAFALNEIPSDQSNLHRRISFSEVFVGRFDAMRLTAYLSHESSEREHYAGHEIFNLQMPGHTDRVCILSNNMVAVSSALGADEIHAMIDRSRQFVFAAMPFEEDLLLRNHYSHVPMGSLVWSILRLKSSPEDEGIDLRHITGYGFLFPPKTVVVGSARYVGSVQVRAEAFTQSPADAQKISSSLGIVLNLLRNPSQHPSNPSITAALDSLKIEQQDSRAVLSATLPDELLKKLFSGKP